jgi:hypothetical protein
MNDSEYLSFLSDEIRELADQVKLLVVDEHILLLMID